MGIKCFPIVNKGHDEVINPEISQRLVCLSADSPGQLGCNREQGHRLMAQALWDPGALSLTTPDTCTACQVPPEQCALRTRSTKLIENRVLLWHSKRHFFQ